MKAARTAEPAFCAAEIVAVAEFVPVLGIRGAARKLDRDPKAVFRHARKLGVRSPFGQGRDWKGAAP